MSTEQFNIAIVITFIIYIIFYFFAFYRIILKQDIKRSFLRTFHNVLFSVCGYKFEEFDNSDDFNSKDQRSKSFYFDQLNLNYEKLCQSKPNNSFSSILDVLETIIYYYDSCSDDIFQKIFKKEKNPIVRAFTLHMCLYIKEMNPFISIPRKEADLMQSILDSIDNNNKSLGTNSLKQLTQEIANKEKLISKQEKDNKRANIVSILGLCLTVFFGLISIIQLFPS